MKTRRKVGVVLVLAALATLTVLAFSGVPLVMGRSAYYVDTGATTHSLGWHWSLPLMAGVFIVGITLILLPYRGKGASDVPAARTGERE